MNTEASVKSAYDRGGADAYYCRRFRPHYYNGTERVEITDKASPEYAAYVQGAHDEVGTKDWGHE